MISDEDQRRGFTALLVLLMLAGHTAGQSVSGAAASGGISGDRSATSAAGQLAENPVPAALELRQNPLGLETDVWLNWWESFFGRGVVLRHDECPYQNRIGGCCRGTYCGSGVLGNQCYPRSTDGQVCYRSVQCLSYSCVMFVCRPKTCSYRQTSGDELPTSQLEDSDQVNQRSSQKNGICSENRASKSCNRPKDSYKAPSIFKTMCVDPEMDYVEPESCKPEGGKQTISEVKPPEVLPPGVHPPGVDLHGVHPPGVNPPGVNPPGVHPHGVDPHGNPLPGVYPPGVDFPGVHPHGVDPHGVNPPGASIPGVNTHGVDHHGVDLHGVNPPGTSLSGLQPHEVALPGVNPPGSDPSTIYSPYVEHIGIEEAGTSSDIDSLLSTGHAVGELPVPVGPPGVFTDANPNSIATYPDVSAISTSTTAGDSAFSSFSYPADTVPSSFSYPADTVPSSFSTVLAQGPGGTKPSREHSLLSRLPYVDLNNSANGGPPNTKLPDIVGSDLQRTGTHNLSHSKSSRLSNFIKYVPKTSNTNEINTHENKLFNGTSQQNDTNSIDDGTSMKNVKTKIFNIIRKLRKG